MKTSLEIWKSIARQLTGIYPEEEAKNISRILMEDLFEISQTEVLLDDTVDLDEEKLLNAVERLLQHEPIQYVTGKAHFYGRDYHVDSNVLIPRPETEELVRVIIDENTQSNPKIIDVGTGSGCIAISLALELGGEVIGTDISEPALSLAYKNSKDLGADVSWIQDDVLNSNLDVEKVDILVSNPPYIPLREMAQMRNNVVAFEPENALFVQDEDPLIFYDQIARLGIKLLNQGGLIYFEIHEDHGNEICKQLEAHGYHDIAMKKDIQEKNRMIRATYSANT